MRAYIDHREPPDFFSLVKQVFPDVIPRQLPFGDLILLNNDQAVVVERKTIHDFVTSMRDNRLWEQLLRLMSQKTIDDATVARRILLICGNVTEYVNKLSEMSDYGMPRLLNSIIGAQLEVLFVYDTPIVFVETSKGVEAFLHTLAQREVQGKNDKNPQSRWFRIRSPSRLPLKDLKVFTLSTVPSIGLALAKVMVNHFGNIANVTNATLDELMSLPGIGPKKAQKIYETFH